MPFVVPTIQRLKGVLKRQACGHALGLFVGHVFGHGAVDVDQVILDVVWQLRGGIQALRILRGFQGMVAHEGFKSRRLLNAILDLGVVKPN